MLGKHVLGLLSNSPLGDMIEGHLWIKLLDYELEVRREAMRRMEDGTPLAQALAQAQRDPETKMKFFTDPVQFNKRVLMEVKQEQHDSGSAAGSSAGASAGGGTGGAGGGQGQ